MADSNILDQFLGFTQTPDIFQNTASEGFKSFTLPEIPVTETLLQDLEKIDHPRNSVLGKRMESFFEIAIKHSDRYDIIGSNIQVIENKKTLGELDFLVLDKYSSKPLHVELVYKLYIYDPEFTAEEERWIGPNRRDSFPEKMEKLNSRQFPILYQPETESYLSGLGVNLEEIEQQLCFKAQLYLPENKDRESLQINKNCLKGNWYRLREFEKMDWKNNLFFSPKKKFWPCDPATNSHWISYSEILKEIELLFERKKSPLIWMKTRTSYSRFFIVWW